MQEDLIPCHIPLGESTTQVLVNPNRTYGNKTGQELIQLYSQKQQKPKPKYSNSIHWQRDKYYNLTVNPEKTIAKGSIKEILALKFVPHTPPEAFNLHLTSDLPETIKIGNSTFDPILIIRCLEEIYKKKLLSVKERKVIKRVINNTITFSVIAPTETVGILVILAKGKAYLICPRLAD